MGVWGRLKQAVKGWLQKLAKSNQEQFGGQAPDCCKTNSPAKKVKR